MKAMGRLVARFSSSGTARNETGVSTAIRGASSDAKGSGAPARRRPRKWLAFGSAILTGLLFLIVAGSAFAAEGPGVEDGTYTPTGPSSVTLRGYVNPHGSEVTDCRFDYGLTTGYGSSAPCAATPEGSQPVEVTAHLSGLIPGTIYHFQLSVTTLVGIASTPDAVFESSSAEPTASCSNQARREEQRSAFLPDCRAWELASPPKKNGADVMANSQRTWAAADGSAVAFSSLAAFGNVSGTGYAADYLAQRTAQPGTQGWTTNGITPRQEPLPPALLAVEPSFRLFSSDLDRGVFRSYTPLTVAPDVAAVPNLYLAEGLRSASPPGYDLATPCVLCAEPGGEPLPPLTEADHEHNFASKLPFVAGASSDLGHIVFESHANLVAPASGTESKVYDYDHGAIRLASVLPDSACGAPPCPDGTAVAGVGAGSALGSSYHYTEHTVSTDGSRIVFTDYSTGDLLEATGRLYQRIDGGTATARTVWLNASERTDCADHDPCTGAPEPEAEQPAYFQDASADGKRVFFTSPQALTDEAGSGLYMYDADAPPGHHLTLIANSGAESKVLGASADGHTVYFNAGQLSLLPGHPDVKGVYSWHDIGSTSTLSFVAPFRDTQGNSMNGIPLEQPDQARVSPDGRDLLFANRTMPVGPTGYNQGHCGDTGSGICRELYLYSADTHRLQCVSCTPSGLAGSASASDVIHTNSSASQTGFHKAHALSDDGRFVFFSTAEALVPQDTNGRSDAYVFDSRTGRPHLLSSGTSPTDSWFMDAGSDGSDAFFLTNQPLLGWDGDQGYDLYDARVSGGFPEPTTLPAPCQGDSCRPSASPAPVTEPASSNVLVGPGDPKPHRRKHRKPKRHHRPPHRRAAHGRGGAK